VPLRQIRDDFRVGADDARDAAAQDERAMYARSVEEAAVRLRELRHEEWADLGLAAVTLALSVAAAHVRSPLALPLFLGGLFVTVRGIRVLWRRWDLVERLAGERDAYVIADVLARAKRDATMERRERYAEGIRIWLEQTGGRHAARLSLAREDLVALAAELENPELDFDPACAVECSRLLTDSIVSPLLNDELQPDELRSRARRIRSGFSARRRA
jgi:hypothetical protein